MFQFPFNSFCSLLFFVFIFLLISRPNKCYLTTIVTLSYKLTSVATNQVHGLYQLNRSWENKFNQTISQQQHKSIIQRARISQFNIIEERKPWIWSATTGHGGLILRLARISATKSCSNQVFRDLFEGFLEGPSDTNLSKAIVPNRH